jgi:hypothetical protein
MPTVIKEAQNCKVTRHDNTLRFELREGSEEVAELLHVLIKVGKLPSEELKCLAYTEDLLNNWEYERIFSQDIAFKLTLEVFNLDWDTSATPPDKYMGLLVEAISERYNTLRKVIKAGFSVLKKYLPNCPATPAELFYQVVEEERTLPFESKLVNDYLRIDAKQRAKFHAELAKKDINSVDWEKLEKLKPAHVNKKEVRSLASTILLTLVENYDRTPKNQQLTIRTQFNHLNENERHLDEVLGEGFTKRTENGRLIPTTTWVGGEMSYSHNGKPPKKQL